MNRGWEVHCVLCYLQTLWTFVWSHLHCCLLGFHAQGCTVYKGAWCMHCVHTAVSCVARCSQREGGFGVFLSGGCGVAAPRPPSGLNQCNVT